MKKQAQKTPVTDMKMFKAIQDGFGYVNKQFVQINKRFKEVESRFDRVDERFDLADERFKLVEARIDQRFGALNERVNSVDARLGVIERDVSKTKNLVLDVQDEVVALNVAIENDARRYFDHEQRIKRLEKAHS